MPSPVETNPAIERAINHLRNFAERNGRDWRWDLWDCWSSGGYRRYGAEPEEASHLQMLRNTQGYGPGSKFIKEFKP